ncbi:MAG TPA: hypothetical protein VE913_08835, partial [Longimicrobium sp.]|nr:hypothetical protein [Longimicrobium sp.]
IDISPMSGLSNVRYWLRSHGFDGDNDGLCNHVFECAKRGDRTLTDAEVTELVGAFLVTTLAVGSGATQRVLS